jgi:predicted nucleotide-binding protein (sugar kinase/HSP70/actin superfamily)
MIAVAEKLACAPKMGDYHVIIDMLIERCLGYKTMLCPPMTRRTLEIGGRHSPDMICTPFKLTLGNFIEAAELGANVFVMPGAGCRLGFYDLLQHQILKDLGYECEMLALFDYVPTLSRLFKSLSSLNPDLTQEKFTQVFDTVARITADMDFLADFIRRNVAFEVNKGEFDAHYLAYLKEAGGALSAGEAESIGIIYNEKMKAVLIDKPERPMRIGIIGEIYLVVEPFSNGHMEKWLAEHGVEIVRPFDLSRMAVAVFTVDEQIRDSGGYVSYNIGSTANEAVSQAYEMMASGGIDGIIHLKPSACSPEITAMSILQNMSRDFQVPVMYLTFDTETSEAGLHTRLEAFYDMIEMKGRKYS